MTETKKRIELSEAAARLGLKAHTLRRYANDGSITYFRPAGNGKIYFDEKDLKEFEEKSTFVAKAA
jgi:excisionase family DNA binding protein